MSFFREIMAAMCRFATSPVMAMKPPIPPQACFDSEEDWYRFVKKYHYDDLPWCWKEVLQPPPKPPSMKEAEK